MSGQQMVFSGEAGCPTFSPNAFKADICSMCRKKIHSHTSATDSQVDQFLKIIFISDFFSLDFSCFGIYCRHSSKFNLGG